MSVLIAAKLNGAVVLGTDSRIMDPTFDHPISDSTRKIVEVGPGAYYASSGWGYSCNWQTAAVQALGRELGTSDIRVLANSLDAISLRRIEETAALLVANQCLHSAVADAASGVAPFHGYVLVGMSEGVPGYVAREFWVVDGRIACKTFEAFELPPGNNFNLYLTRGPLVDAVIRDPKTWRGGAAAGVEKLLAEFQARHPHIGGPPQMVEIDAEGSRWIHECTAQPPSAAGVALTSATLAAGVIYGGTVQASQVVAGLLSGCTLDITSGSEQLKVNSTDGFYYANSSVRVRIKQASDPGGLFGGVKVTHPTNQEYTQISPGWVFCQDPGAYGGTCSTNMNYLGVTTQDAAGNSAGISAGACGANTVTNGAYVAPDGLYVGPFTSEVKVLGTRKTGWSAASGTASRSSFSTSTVTTEELAKRVKAIIDDLMSHGAFGA